MSPVNKQDGVRCQIIRLQEDVTGPQISNELPLVIERIFKIFLLVADCKELLHFHFFHFFENRVVNCSILCHLLQQEDSGLDRSELLQVLEVAIQESLQQPPGGFFPALVCL